MGGPLWNHDMPTANSYKMYISTAVAAPTGTNAANTTNVYKATDGKKVDTNSILCLSCHDGSIALDSFGGATSTTAGAINSSSKANLGTDLTNDHPIGEAAKWQEVSYMVSRSYRDGSRIRLQPANPSMQPIMVDPDQVQVQGVVVGVMRKY